MFLLIIGALVVVSGLAALRHKVEKSVLFAGAGSQDNVLPHGWVYHENGSYYTVSSTENANGRHESNVRHESNGTVMFLHGNGADAPSFASMVKLLTDKGYRVIVPEYLGYGRLGGEKTSIAGTRNLLVAVWNKEMKKSLESKRSIVSSSDRPRILMGFSLGGAFAHSIVDRLCTSEETKPNRLVLINTLAGLQNMTCGTALSSVSSDSWDITKHHQKWKGSVLLVHSPKDEIFGAEHVKTFKTHFSRMNIPVTEHILQVPDQSSCHYHSHSPMIDRDWVNKI